MRILAQLVAWLVLPAMTTVLVIGLWQNCRQYQPINQGHALRAPTAECVPSPDEMFNACAVLDTSQVRDLRTETGNTELEIP